jgi:hypothetical protein
MSWGFLFALMTVVAVARESTAKCETELPRSNERSHEDIIYE